MLPAVVDKAEAETLWTGDRWVDRMLAAGGLTRADWRAAVARVREGLDATLPPKRTTRETLDKHGQVHVLETVEEGGAPDHPARLRAAEDMAEWLGFRGKRERDGGEDDGKPSELHLHYHAGPLPQNRHANGNGHAPSRPPLRSRRVSIRLDGG